MLDTNATLEAAQSLYRTSGYDEIEPYNDNPNATHWFGKSLANRPKPPCAGSRPGSTMGA